MTVDMCVRVCACVHACVAPYVMQFKFSFVLSRLGDRQTKNATASTSGCWNFSMEASDLLLHS